MDYTLYTEALAEISNALTNMETLLGFLDESTLVSDMVSLETINAKVTEIKNNIENDVETLAGKISRMKEIDTEVTGG